MTVFVRYRMDWLLLAGALLLGGCGSKPLNQPPVEDRNASAGKVSSQDGRLAKQSSLPSAPAVTLPGAENAGKPGYYTVKPGDMLIRIALEAGQSHKDIARWNNVENPNKIEVGQVLRIIPPLVGEVVAKPVVTSAVTATPIASGTVPTSPAKTAVAPGTAASAVAVAPATVLGDEEINWIWPANGIVLAAFDDVKNKGVDIGGSAGESVLAAADGRVVYAGAGLRGYGNLIILKHNNVYLTAYAHNQTLLVKEDQSVKKGQKIAEMGNTDADRVKLHFEVRRQGKPVDPQKYLPAK